MVIIDTLLIELLSVSAYRNMLELEAMEHILDLLEEMEQDTPSANVLVSLYSSTYYVLKRDRFDSLHDYLLHHLKYDDSPFAQQYIEKTSVTEVSDFSNVVAADLKKLSRLAKLPCRTLKSELMRVVGSKYTRIISNLPEWETGYEITLQTLTSSYKKKGAGIFSQGKAFYWENSTITPVVNPDPIDYFEMIGYEWQRQEVINNTRGLVEGKPANNILLYGDSGTGKSATIKSLINNPDFFNLRIVEVAKDSFDELKVLIRFLSDKNLKFIIFIDDLTFDCNDKGYSALKSVLEGGLEVRPDNVVIYATSNRRHFIREYFSDRQGDDVHTDETIQERISLADRFGLRIPFMSLNQEQFLDMIEKLVEYAGLEITKEDLLMEANKWELEHAGRTPRIARQFTDYLQNMAK